MYEVELKVRAEHGEVRDRLRELAPECVGTVRQVDTYYDHPNRDFGTTDEAVRLRREIAEEEEALLTYKEPLVERASKTRAEVETPVNDGDAADEIFQRLGFEPVATVEKERTTYTHAGYTIALDTVVGLGQFVEVETEADDVEPARVGAQDLLCDLGLNPDDHVRTSYLELLLAGGERGCGGSCDGGRVEDGGSHDRGKLG